MRAQEFLGELVTRAETTEHLIKRLNYAADLCDTMGDSPLLVREFKTGLGKETVLAKVINKTEKEGSRHPKYVKGGVGKEGQVAILEKLGIENPVFTKMDLPNNTFAFHGDPHIFIPPPGSNVYWSPKIEDLGGQRLAGESPAKSELRTSISVGWMAKEADKWAATYQSEMPQEFTKNEIIWDCEYYYLLNIQSFLNRFSGKANKMSMIDAGMGSKTIDPSVWAERVRNYSDIANFLRKTGVSYVRWYQDNVEGKSPGERQSHMATKPPKPGWTVKSETGQSVLVSADDEQEAIWQALNARGASGRFGMFPKGKDSITSVEKNENKRINQ
jgi:hypothetical protein